MSMLDRYRKPGGFEQLLALIETCNPEKQEKLLDIIGQEDRRWSETVRAKMLSIERIYSWNDQALAEVFGALQDLTVAVALHAASGDLKIRITGFFTHGRIRKIEDLLASKGPSASEISATHMKIIESVRKMESDGFLRFEVVDPVLVISDDIDNSLSQKAGPAPMFSTRTIPPAQAQAPSSRVLHSYSPLKEHVAAQMEASGAPIVSHAPAYSPQTEKTEVNESRLIELQNLKKRVADLSKDNAVLRHELSLAKAKLDQIKKIA